MANDAMMKLQEHMDKLMKSVRPVTGGIHPLDAVGLSDADKEAILTNGWREDEEKTFDEHVREWQKKLNVDDAFNPLPKVSGVLDKTFKERERERERLRRAHWARMTKPVEKLTPPASPMKGGKP